MKDYALKMAIARGIRNMYYIVILGNTSETGNE